jgi:hypothetical protein
MFNFFVDLVPSLNNGGPSYAVRVLRGKAKLFFLPFLHSQRPSLHVTILRPTPRCADLSSSLAAFSTVRKLHEFHCHFNTPPCWDLWDVSSCIFFVPRLRLNPNLTDYIAFSSAASCRVCTNSNSGVIYTNPRTPLVGPTTCYSVTIRA